MGFAEYRAEYLSDKKWIKIYNYWKVKYETVEVEEAQLMLSFVLAMVTVVVFGWIYGLVLWIKEAKDDDPGYMDLETESDPE